MASSQAGNCFWDHFPNFPLDPSASITTEFLRLAEHRQWKTHGKRYNRELALCFEQAFEYQYGNDASRLDGWQDLCDEVGVSPVPGTITQCRKALQKVHVNLVDLIDSRRLGVEVKQFNSLNALRKYSKNTGKIFPKNAAKADGFLRALLRTMG